MISVQFICATMALNPPNAKGKRARRQDESDFQQSHSTSSLHSPTYPSQSDGVHSQSAQTEHSPWIQHGLARSLLSD